MIARLWSARTTSTLSGAYLEHFTQEVQPALQKLHGFLGFTVCTRQLPNAVEVLVTTYWSSLSAVDAFAGADRECAVVANQAAALLTDFDRRARHYELALATFPQP